MADNGSVVRTAGRKNAKPNPAAVSVNLKKCFLCKLCDSSFKSTASLAKHELKHNQPGGFPCRDCKQTFISELDQASHREKKHKIFDCQICDIQFDTNAERHIHIADAHVDAKTSHPLKCSECGALFGKAAQLRQHIQTKCGTDKPFKCELCDARFSSPTTLGVHYTIHDGEKTNLCRFCGNSFLSKGQLKVHERSHTGEKPFKCDQCPKSFAYRESLVTHSSVHTGIKPYICEGCNHRFSCIGNLIKHRRIRPDTCGQPQFNRNTKCAPRPSGRTDQMVSKKRKTRKGNTRAAPNVDISNVTVLNNSRESDDEGRATPTTEIVDDNADPIEQHFMSEEDVVMNVEIEYVPGDDMQPATNEESEIEEYDIVISDLEINTDKWPESVEYVQEEDIAEISKYLGPDDEAMMDGDPEYLEDEEECAEYDVFENITIKSETSVKEMETHDIEVDETALKLEDDGTSTSISHIDTKPIACNFCSSKFDGQSTYAEHLRSYHNIVMENIRADKTNELGHLAEWAPTIKQPSFQENIGSPIHKCACCPMQFATTDTRFAHQLDAHRSQVFCQKCQIAFSQPDDLVSHYNSQLCSPEHLETSEPTTTQKTKQPPIHYSTETASQASYELLSAAIKIGTSAKIPRALRPNRKSLRSPKSEFMCLKCGRKFTTKIALTDHEESKCGDEPKYRCDVCQKGYHSAGSLRTHISVHTGELPHACAFCDKTFRTQGQVKVHERKHNGEKPFQCEFCDKRFGYRESLLTHVSTHTGMKRFLCGSCGGRFSCISNLQAHRKSHWATCGQTPKITKPVIATSDVC